jgi:hypothetical protein
LQDLITKYGSDARKFIYDYADATDLETLYYQQPKKIVVHHSATAECNVNTISSAHAGRAN